MSALDEVRPARPASLIVFLVLSIGIALVGMALVATVPQLSPAVLAMQPTPVLALSAALRIVVVVGVIMLWLGNLTWRDIGLAWDRLPAGLALTTTTWILAQLLGVIGGLATTGEIRQHPELGLRQVHLTLAALTSHVLAVSLLEEIAYRGYLLPQLYVVLSTRWSQNGGRALAGALVLSQTVFAVLHVPLFMFSGMAPDLIPYAVLGIGIVGLAFSLMYLGTGNLFFVMGVHTLVTAPTPLFAFLGPDWLGVLLAALAVALLSARLPRGLRFPPRTG